MTNIFEEIYKYNIWDDKFSRSGTGSNLKQTEKLRAELPLLVKNLNIKSFLDIPCGDFFWMKEIQSEMENLMESYQGCDIVNDAIEANYKKYGSAKSKFSVLNLLSDTIPNSDMIFCRDCLVHFSYHDILKAIINIKKSKSIYLLTTTFPGRTNRNIKTGAWRPIDLQKFPFYFPEPLRIIKENTTEFNGEFNDKALGLWSLSSISILRFRIIMAFYTPLRRIVLALRNK